MCTASVSTELIYPSEPPFTAQKLSHTHSSDHHLDSQLLPLALKTESSSGVHERPPLCGKKHESRLMHEGSLQPSEQLRAVCISSWSVLSFGQKEEKQRPTATASNDTPSSLTQDLLSKATTGNFGGYHHCFDSKTPEDPMGTSAEQRSTARVIKDGWAGLQLHSASSRNNLARTTG